MTLVAFIAMACLFFIGLAVTGLFLLFIWRVAIALYYSDPKSW